MKLSQFYTAAFFMTCISKQDQQGEDYYSYSYLGHKIISHTIKTVNLRWMAEDELINPEARAKKPVCNLVVRYST